MPKKKIDKEKQKLLGIKISGEERRKRLEEQLGSHLSESSNHFQELRSGWDDKEAMLVCALEDELSKDSDTHSQVFDPRLSTIVFERAARVMAQNPRGKAYPVSKNDIGKSKFMNLLLDYYTKNANYWHSMIIKSRIMDLYSLVYGTMFGLVPWMVNEKSNYIGPEFIPLPIRGCFPQPSATSLNEADWFQVSSMKSLNWIEKKKNQKGWINIDKLIDKVKHGKEDGDEEEVTGDVKPGEYQTYVEQNWYPEQSGDKGFPKVWLQTEYRRDKWLVFAPNYGNMLIRDIPNPFDNDDLPIVSKHAFPLMDSIIGLGEFERGQTLQLAINSLINLYLDGVKYSIFPPMQVDPNNVVQSSLKWSPGAMWLTKRPGMAIQQTQLSPQGLQTFQSTYGFMVSALLNQAGTSSTTQPENVEQMMGRTPQGLRMQAAKESARDEWDRVMMEDTIKQVYTKWIQAIVKKQEKKVSVRLFGEEAKQLAEDYSDVVEFFENENYGIAEIGKDALAAEYDYEIESGSTLKRDADSERFNLTEILGLVLKSPMIIQAMNQRGKDLDLGELFKRWVIASGINDYEKIITDISPDQMMAQGGQMGPGGGAPSTTGGQTGQMPQIEDPEIAQVFEAVSQMSRGVPPMNRGM